MVVVTGDVLTTDPARAGDSAAPAAPTAGVGPPRARLSAAVVSGNEVVRRGIEGLLRADPAVGQVHGCPGPAGLAPLLQRSMLDLVVVTAADAGWLVDRHPDLAAAGVSVLVAVDRAALADGFGAAVPPADGFLWQPDLTAARLREALRRCRSGELPMPPELTRALLARTDPGIRRPRPGSVNLTSREREALALIVRGLSNKQIAKRLSISSHSAKRLVANLMLKLDAPNRTLAAVIALRAGMVEDPAPGPDRDRWSA